MNILVEKKKEFTVRIINILSPLILEGLVSIYNKAKEVSTGDNVLKIFQSFLKRIPKWNEELILAEINRIKTNSRDYELLFDLIKATIKSNLYILAYSPGQSNNTKINPEYYKNIDFNKFIHDVYIECAREIWNNPYLFYHNYPGIEIKRNQRDTIELIKNCIEESIRKTMPLKHVLEIYLGDEFEQQVPDDNFEKTITEVDERNLKQLLKKDLADDDKPISNNSNFIGNEQEINQVQPEKIKTLGETLEEANNTNNTATNRTRSSSSSTDRRSKSQSYSQGYSHNNSQGYSQSYSQSYSQRGGDEPSKEVSTATKELNSKILNIINKGNIQLSDDNNTSEKKIEKSNKLSETSSENLISTNMDSKLQKLLKNDLGESETESSANFKPEKNKNSYQEIFSNSNNDSTNTQEKNEEVNKNKFFSNYLQF